LLIDPLTKYSNDEQDKIIEVAKRHHAHTYHRGTNFDLYKEYDAPYWGDGECEHGSCKHCKYNTIDEIRSKMVYENHYDDNEERCYEYSDGAFYEWFNSIITNDEKIWIENIDKPFEKAIVFYDNEEYWEKIYDDYVDLTLLKWLNDKNITYHIIKGLLDFSVNLYYKKESIWDDHIREYRLRFGDATTIDYMYAISHLGWYRISIYDMAINDDDINDAIEWIDENHTGIVLKYSNVDGYSSNDYLFENDEDIMGLKLRWME